MRRGLPAVAMLIALVAWPATAPAAPLLPLTPPPPDIAPLVPFAEAPIEKPPITIADLPLPPSPSELPWSVENLRFCNWCEQLAQKDLNDCPTCGRRMAALPR